MFNQRSSRMLRRGRRDRITVVALVLVCATLLVLGSGNDRFDSARDAAGSAFDPIERGGAAVVDPIGHFFRGLPHVGSRQSEIDKLKRENAQLRTDRKTDSLDESRSDQLRELKLLAGRSQFHVSTAQVIDYGPSLGFEWTVRINRGSRDGVRSGMTVINADGLVGRVKSVSRGTSTVVLAADPGSSVGVRVVRTGELGIVTGAGTARMHFTPLDPTSRVHSGDVLVTGPNGRSTYASGVPFGKITKVISGGTSSTPTGQVTSDVDFTSLDVVGVVLSSPSQPGGAGS